LFGDGGDLRVLQSWLALNCRPFPTRSLLSGRFLDALQAASAPSWSPSIR
jgi:hypothetical protein